MTRLSLLAFLALTACAVPDDCYTRRAETMDCLERQRTDPRVKCKCQAIESSDRSVSVTPPPTVIDPPDEPEEPVRNTGEPPGRKGIDRDEAAYDHWKSEGWW
jgi:hypothetical protein